MIVKITDKDKHQTFYRETPRAEILGFSPCNNREVNNDKDFEHDKKVLSKKRNLKTFILQN